MNVLHPRCLDRVVLLSLVCLSESCPQWLQSRRALRARRLYGRGRAQRLQGRVPLIEYLTASCPTKKWNWCSSSPAAISFPECEAFAPGSSLFAPGSSLSAPGTSLEEGIQRFRSLCRSRCWLMGLRSRRWHTPKVKTAMVVSCAERLKESS